MILESFVACPEGLYGENCSQPCNCKDNTTCSAVNGACRSGCPYGFTGLSCSMGKIFQKCRFISHSIAYFFVAMSCTSIYQYCGIYFDSNGYDNCCLLSVLPTLTLPPTVFIGEECGTTTITWTRGDFSNLDSRIILDSYQCV